MLQAPLIPVAEGVTLISFDTISVVSPLILAVLMAVIIAVLVLVRNAANAKAGVKQDPEPWACGYEPDPVSYTHLVGVSTNRLPSLC